MIVPLPNFLACMVAVQLATPSSAEQDLQNTLGPNDETTNYRDFNHVPIIRIQSDGKSCPTSFQKASRLDLPQIGLTCVQSELNMAGNEPVRENKAVCCYRTDQKVFLVSTEGHATPRPSAQYSLDAKTCCPTGQDEAITGLQECKHGSDTLKVQQKELTHCCWDAAKNDFIVHMKDHSAGLTVALNNSTTQKLDNTVCSEVYLRVGDATLRPSNVQLDVFAELKCAVGNKSDRQVLTVNFNRNRLKAGAFTFDFGLGKVVAEVSSQMVETSPKSGKYDIKIHGEVSGTGALAKVHTAFDPENIPHNEYLDAFIKAYHIC